MATITKIVIGFIISLFLSSCNMDLHFDGGKKGNGNVTTEERNVEEEFTQIKVSEGLTAFVSQGNSFEIKVEADENIIDLINTDVKDGILRIETEKAIGKSKSKKVLVTLPEIDKLVASSGSNLLGQTVLEGDAISIKSSSGADIEVELDVQQLEVKSSSGSDIKLSGTTNFMKSEASSGSSIKAQELETTICEARASSGADIYINVSKELTAKAGSGGNISYTGTASITANKSAAGSITRL